MIESAVEHFQRDTVKGESHGIGDGITQVDKDGIEEPGGPDLELDTVDRTGPEIGEMEQPFGGFVRIFNGLITNDKFCLTRTGELDLTWWRRPLRLREKKG